MKICRCDGVLSERQSETQSEADYRLQNWKDEKLYKIDEIATAIGALFGIIEFENFDHRADEKWVSVAKTHFGEGCMALRKAIHKNDNF